MHLIANIVLFQIGWFACVLGAANNLAWIGSLTALAIAVLHVQLAKRSAVELQLLLLVVTLGFAWDSLIASAGLMQFNSGVMLDGLAPYWMAALWLAFATTLNVSMRWMRGRVLIAILFGAIGGPLAYYAGAKLGALSFPDPVLGLTAQAVGWGLLMPLLVKIAVRFDGIESQSPQEQAYV
jgi:Protein of unknown function (DUF2878)